MESVISRESKQAEISALSTKLETTHAALTSVEADIGTKQAARIALQQAVDRLIAQKEALDRNVQEAHAVIERAETARHTQAELDRAVIETRRSLLELKNDGADLASAIASEQQRAADLRAEREGEAVLLQAIRGNLETLRADRDRAEGERAAAQRELAGLHARIEEARQRLTAVSSQLDNGRNELGALEGKLDSLRAQANKANQDTGRETAALATVRGQREKLAGEVAQLDSRKSALEQEIARLLPDRQAIDQARTELTAVRAELASTQDELRRVQSGIEVARVQEQTLSGRIRDLNARQARLEPVRQDLATAETRPRDHSSEVAGGTTWSWGGARKGQTGLKRC